MSRVYNDQGPGWRCPNCGKSNKAESRFCSGCGTPRPQNNYDPYGDSGYGRAARSVYPLEEPKRKSGALKVIAIVLICLLVSAAIGFAVYKLFLEDKGEPEEQKPGSKTEQIADDPSEEEDRDEDPQPSSREPSAEPEEPQQYQNTDSRFVIGNTYTVVAKEGVRVRKGPGTNYDQIKREALSSEYQSQALKGDLACLKEGAKVTCLGMDGDWMQITDGWICVYDGKDDLVK